jgi:hypothetical protein
LPESHPETTDGLRFFDAKVKVSDPVDIQIATSESIESRQNGKTTPIMSLGTTRSQCLMISLHSKK